ncbi:MULTISPECIES: hypothetical protein [unclassified Aeromicrobium]|uniref:hypothetical protein n=1 Tax=unclassified Aeromicrobium TaxID=2633570 RepID=UPI00288C3A1D|nr:MULTISPECIES: hypothetical protein [unclassified Aeromicrobium]
MSTVALLPPLTSGGGAWPGEPLTEARPYLRTRRMGRWHQPRSGYRIDRVDRTVVALWCGQHINDLEHAVACDTPPDGEPACGTCAGRRAGYAGDDGLIFQPWTIDRPDTCPGWRGLYEALPRTRVARCLTCGALAPLRAVGGWHTGDEVIARHETGEQLVDPCPFHAWRNLARDPTSPTPTVVCSCLLAGLY